MDTTQPIAINVSTGLDSHHNVWSQATTSHYHELLGLKGGWLFFVLGLFLAFFAVVAGLNWKRGKNIRNISLALFAVACLSIVTLGFASQTTRTTQKADSPYYVSEALAQQASPDHASVLVRDADLSHNPQICSDKDCVNTVNNSEARALNEAMKNNYGLTAKRSNETRVIDIDKNAMVTVSTEAMKGAEYTNRSGQKLSCALGVSNVEKDSLNHVTSESLQIVFCDAPHSSSVQLMNQVK